MYLRKLLTFTGPIKRQFSSALYITDDKAQTTFALLTPYINFEEQLARKHNLAENINLRKINLDIDKIERKWSFFKEITEQKTALENNSAIIGSTIRELLNDAEKNSADVTKLKMHLKLVKTDLKNLKEYYYDIEENVMLQILNLPNDLHERTPKESESIVYEHLTKTDEKSKMHLEIAKELNIIEYIDPLSCYLKSTAALFEVSLQNYFRKFLLNSNFTHFSNPDFVRSIVAEGCGVDFKNPSNIFMLEHATNDRKPEILSRLHLVGAASLEAFMAYFTKHSVTPAYFPLRYFSLGRLYRPTNSTNSQGGLFNLSQQSVVNTFIASEEEGNLLNEIIQHVISLYSNLDQHFKLVLLPAHQLNFRESLRLSIQMFSNYSQSYVEVGYVSYYGNFFSKRLLFNCSGKNKERSFPNVFAGTLLNVHKLLGCCLENNSVSNKELLNDLLRKHVWS